MLQAYSSSLTVAANTPYVLNNVVIDKGAAETLSGPASIHLNTRGVYLVEVDGFATPDTAALTTVQLYVNGVAQPQAFNGFTGVADSYGAFGFKTLVRVTQNNCNCCCVSSPTVLQIMNGDTAVSDAHINVVVTKIC